MNRTPIPERTHWWMALLALSLAACDGQKPAPLLPAAHAQTGGAVTALGRVVPGRAVIAIAAAPGDRLLRLEVKEGEQVQAAQPLAYLETHALRLAERDAAQVALEEARARLEAEGAYGQAAIEQANESIRLIEAELTQARRDLVRVETLVHDKVVTPQRYDEQLLLVESRELALNKARAERRSAEASLARAQVTAGIRSAEAQLRTAQERLALTVIRAPQPGRVLRIHTWPGEAIGNAPILQLGDTERTTVVAEVHETDIGKVRVGQRASFTSPALAAPLAGVVEEIGWLIHKEDVHDVDPRAHSDTRVVEVRIRAETPEAIARLTHLEVRVRIEAGNGAP